MRNLFERKKEEFLVARVLVLGHGTFPQDLLRTTEMICGPSEGVDTIDLPAGQDMEAYRAAVEERMNLCGEDGLLILADLKGGTPFLTASRLMREHWESRIELVTGVNLPMLAEVVSSMDQTPVEELAACAAETGRQGVTDLREIFCQRRQEGAR